MVIIMAARPWRLLLGIILGVCLAWDTPEVSLGQPAPTDGLLRVSPPVLIFKHSPTCIPAVALIDLENAGLEGEVQVLSISSDQPQFHPAMFKPHVLPPGSRTQVQIIYLPRSAGDSEGTLTIATSEGDLKYSIQASAVPNPYRLHPLVGTKVPAGVLYSRPVIIFNPSETETLFVSEVFTTESFLHLQLPDELEGGMGGGAEVTAASADGENMPLSGHAAPDGLWQIPPRSERELVVLQFRATAAGPFSGYVHVKTDRDNLVLAVELLVLAGGLHPHPKDVDFGVLTSPDERRSVAVSLLNSGNAAVALIEAGPASDDPHLHVAYAPGAVVQPGDTLEGALVLTYAGALPGNVHGKVVVVTNHSNAGLASVEVWYSAHVLHGGVGYERGHVSFLVPAAFANASSSSAAAGASSAASSVATATDATAAAAASGAAAATATNRRSDVPGYIGAHLTSPQAAYQALQVAHELRAQALADPQQASILRLVPFTNYFPVPLALVSATVEACGSALFVEETPGSASSSWASHSRSTAKDASSNNSHSTSGDSRSSSDSGSDAKGYEEGAIAMPQARWPDVRLRFAPWRAAAELALPHTCTLKLVTNVSTHHIPVHVYSGKLHVAIPLAARRPGCGAGLLLADESHVDSTGSSNDSSRSRGINLDTNAPSTAAAVANTALKPLPPPVSPVDERVWAGGVPAPLVPPDDRTPWVDAHGLCFAGPSPQARESGRSNVAVLDFGKLAHNQIRTQRFNFTNFNPVPVNVSASATALSGASVAYVGQWLSPWAGVELVEIYEDMVSQGAVPPGTVGPAPHLQHPASVNAGRISSGSGSGEGASGAADDDEKSRTSSGGKKKGRKAKKAAAAAAAAAATAAAPEGEEAASAVLASSSASSKTLSEVTGRGFSSGQGAHGDAATMKAPPPPLPVTEFAVLPGHTAVFEVGVWSGKIAHAVVDSGGENAATTSTTSGGGAAVATAAPETTAAAAATTTTKRGKKRANQKGSDKFGGRTLNTSAAISLSGLGVVVETPVETVAVQVAFEVLEGSVHALSGSKTPQLLSLHGVVPPPWSPPPSARSSARGNSSSPSPSLAAVHVASSFDEPIELCVLTSSRPQWIKAQLRSPAKSARNHSGSVSGGCLSTNSGSGGSSSMKALSLPARASDKHVGDALFWPDPPCDDAWHCVSRWAETVSNSAQRTLDVAAIEAHRKQRSSISTGTGSSSSNERNATELAQVAQMGTVSRDLMLALANLRDLPWLHRAGSMDDDASLSTDELSTVAALLQAWDNFTQLDLHRIDASIGADTSVGRFRHLATASAFLELPDLQLSLTADHEAATAIIPAPAPVGTAAGSPSTLEPPMGFPLTAIGAVSSSYVAVFNPNAHAVHAQLCGLAHDPKVALSEGPPGMPEVYDNYNSHKGGAASSSSSSSSGSSRPEFGAVVTKTSVDVAQHPWWNLKLRAVSHGLGSGLDTTATDAGNRGANANANTKAPQTRAELRAATKAAAEATEDAAAAAEASAIAAADEAEARALSAAWSSGGRSYAFGRRWGGRILALKSTASGEVASVVCAASDGQACGHLLRGSRRFLQLKDDDGNDDGDGDDDHEVGARGSLEDAPVHSHAYLPTWTLEPDSEAVAGGNDGTNSEEEREPPPAPFYLPYGATEAVSVPPRGTVFLGPVLFRPHEHGLHSTSVFVRNNATWLHELVLEARGGRGVPVLRTPDGRPHGAGSIVALRFVLNSSHWASSSAEGGGAFGSESAAASGQTEGRSYRRLTANNEWVVDHKNDAPSLTPPPMSGSASSGSGSGPSDAWPIPAQHVCRVENHGDMPLEVTELSVGSGQGLQTCGASTRSSTISTTTATATSSLIGGGSEAAAWPLFGFSVGGCLALPVVLPPHHAWEIPVAYRTDCTSANELASLRVGTSAGYFDVVLQALTDPQEMRHCEASRLAAQSSLTFRVSRYAFVVCGLFVLLLAVLDISGLARDAFGVEKIRTRPKQVLSSSSTVTEAAEAATTDAGADEEETDSDSDSGTDSDSDADAKTLKAPPSAVAAQRRTNGAAADPTPPKSASSKAASADGSLKASITKASINAGAQQQQPSAAAATASLLPPTSGRQETSSRNKGGAPTHAIPPTVIAAAAATETSASNKAKAESKPSTAPSATVKASPPRRSSNGAVPKPNAHATAAAVPVTQADNRSQNADNAAAVTKAREVPKANERKSDRNKKDKSGGGAAAAAAAGLERSNQRSDADAKRKAEGAAAAATASAAAAAQRRAQEEEARLSAAAARARRDADQASKAAQQALAPRRPTEAQASVTVEGAAAASKARERQQQQQQQKRSAGRAPNKDNKKGTSSSSALSQEGPPGLARVLSDEVPLHQPQRGHSSTQSSSSMPRQRDPLDLPPSWQGLNTQAVNSGGIPSAFLNLGENNSSVSFFGRLGFVPAAPAVDADDAAAADLNIDSFFSTLAQDSSLMGDDAMPSLGGGFGPSGPASEAGSGGSDGGLGLGLGTGTGTGGNSSDCGGALKSPSDRLAAIAGGLFDNNRDSLGGGGGLGNGFGAIGAGTNQPPPGLGSGLGGFAGGFGSVLGSDNSHPLRGHLGGAELSSSLGGAAAGVSASPAAARQSRFGFALSGNGGSFGHEDELLGLTSTAQAPSIGLSGAGGGGGGTGGGGQNGMRDYHQGVEEMDFLSGGTFFSGKPSIGGNQVTGSAFFNLPGSAANDESEALGGLSQALDGDNDGGNEDDPAWA